jgi:hypothetical protein
MNRPFCRRSRVPTAVLAGGVAGRWAVNLRPIPFSTCRDFALERSSAPRGWPARVRSSQDLAAKCADGAPTSGAESG